MDYRTDAHDHVDDGAVHAHISSTAFYVAIFVGLLMLTGLTVGQSYVDLGRLNIVLVVLIATMKASLVVTFFMHLRWDNKFNALMFISSLFFIGVFFAYTMNDTDQRGEFDSDHNVPVWDKTGEPAPGGFVTKQPHTPSPSEPNDHAPPAGADPHGSVPVQQH
ncbi:MAG: Cytochrome c oxidase polypeptide [Labilithrix sp.]|nr:Cytochrome c oxidase polypeptide [Labilithrix sp.]